MATLSLILSFNSELNVNATPKKTKKTLISWDAHGPWDSPWEPGPRGPGSQGSHYLGTRWAPKRTPRKSNEIQCFFFAKINGNKSRTSVKDVFLTKEEQFNNFHEPLLFHIKKKVGPAESETNAAHKNKSVGLKHANMLGMLAWLVMTARF